MTDYYKDPISGVYLPAEEVGYSQLKSGLWVPKDCGKNEDTTFASVCTAPHSTPTSNDIVKSTLEILAKFPKKPSYEPFPSVMSFMDISFHAIPKPAPYRPYLADITREPYARWREDFECNALRPHLESVLELDTAAATRLATSLWLGTEVCCLNLRRLNDLWKNRIRSRRKKLTVVYDELAGASEPPSE